MSDEQVQALLEDAGRLARVEAAVLRIESKIAALEQAIGPVLANPGKLLAKMMTGGR